jgi:plasmid stabilization system protein ParE
LKRVILSQDVRAFVLRETNYLRQHSPAAAIRFAARLREARQLLSNFDHAGFVRDAPPVPGLRRLVVGDYLIDYFPGKTVLIVAMRHGRQQEPGLDVEDDLDYE